MSISTGKPVCWLRMRFASPSLRTLPGPSSLRLKPRFKKERTHESSVGFICQRFRHVGPKGPHGAAGRESCQLRYHAHARRRPIPAQGCGFYFRSFRGTVLLTIRIRNESGRRGGACGSGSYRYERARKALPSRSSRCRRGRLRRVSKNESRGGHGRSAGRIAELPGQRFRHFRGQGYDPALAGTLPLKNLVMSMNISGLVPPIPASPELAAPSLNAAASSLGSSATSFKDVLSGAINEVESSRASAAESVNRFMSGEGDDLHSTILASQRAELEFQMFMQVRNKVVSAYQEVMKMQL